MALTNLRMHNAWSFVRASPYMNLYFTGILFFLKQDFESLYFAVIMCISAISNSIFKKIFKSIYSSFGIDEVPVLGKGVRPKGATNCGAFLKFPDKESSSYGMPSGHSQSIWFFVSYIILCMYDKHNTLFNTKHLNDKVKFVSIFLLIFFAFLTSYSRVVIEKCHTIQQVLVGAIFGIVMAYVAFIIKDKIHKVLNKHLDVKK